MGDKGIPDNLVMCPQRTYCSYCRCFFYCCYYFHCCYCCIYCCRYNRSIWTAQSLFLLQVGVRGPCMYIYMCMYDSLYGAGLIPSYTNLLCLSLVRRMVYYRERSNTQHANYLSSRYTTHIASLINTH